MDKVTPKYVLVQGDCIQVEKDGENHILHRIRALRSFADVKKGDLGGYIEVGTLSHSGNAWVYDNAKVLGGEVVGDAQVRGDSTVTNRIGGNAIIINNESYRTYRSYTHDTEKPFPDPRPVADPQITESVSNLAEIMDLVDLSTKETAEQSQNAHDETRFNMNSAPENTKVFVISSSEELVTALQTTLTELNTVKQELKEIKQQVQEEAEKVKMRDTLKLQAANMLHGIKQIAAHSRDFVKEKANDLQAACEKVGAKTAETVKTVYENAKQIEKNAEKTAIDKYVSIADEIKEKVSSTHEKGHNYLEKLSKGVETACEEVQNSLNAGLHSVTAAASHLAYQKAIRDLNHLDKLVGIRNIELTARAMSSGREIGSFLETDIKKQIEHQKKLLAFADKCVSKAEEYEGKMLEYADKYEYYALEEGYAAEQGIHYDKNEALKEMHGNKLDAILKSAEVAAMAHGTDKDVDKVKEFKNNFERS